MQQQMHICYDDDAINQEKNVMYNIPTRCRIVIIKWNKKKFLNKQNQQSKHFFSFQKKRKTNLFFTEMQLYSNLGKERGKFFDNQMFLV